MSHHHLGGTGVFVAAFLAYAMWATMWAGHPSQPATAESVWVADYPYAGAVCEFGATGGPDCANPHNANDMYDWGYWKSRKFGPSDQWGYEYRNCTSYVAWRLARAGVHPARFTDLGDASQWIANVRGKRGVVVNKRPSPGAVAAWDFAGVGHVAWVVSVRGSRVTVADYNYAGTGVYDQHVIESSPTGYIHFSRLSVTDVTGFG
jgi:surface antigen